MSASPPVAEARGAAARRRRDSPAARDRRARSALEQIGYDEHTLAQVLLRPAFQIDAARGPLGAPALESRPDVQALIELLLAARSVPRARAVRLLGPAVLDALRGAGWVAARGTRLVASTRVVPYRGTLLLCDFGRGRGRDRVLGVSPSTHALVKLAGRDAGGRTLDLGTGCGVLAVLSADAGASVLATDVNPRALMLARRNAELNAVGPALELAEADGLRGLPARRFDTVLANLPYVVAPRCRSRYQHSGHPGDAYVRDVLTAVPPLLSETGAAYLLASWAQREGESPLEPVERALGGFDGHAIVLVFTIHEPAAYAAAWSGVLKPSSPRTRRRWLAYYRRHGFQRFVEAAVVLYRHPRVRGLRSLGLAGALGEAAHGQLAAIRAAVETGATDLRRDELLRRPFALAPQALLHATAARAGGRWVETEGQVLWRDGLPLDASVDGATVEALRASDGVTPLTHQSHRALGDDMSDRVARDLQWLVRCGLVTVSP